MQTPIFGTLGGSVQEIHSLDIKTRKKIISTGNLHIYRDIERLCLRRGGSQIVTPRKYLSDN